MILLILWLIEIVHIHPASEKVSVQLTDGLTKYVFQIIKKNQVSDILMIKSKIVHEQPDEQPGEQPNGMQLYVYRYSISGLGWN